MGGSRNRGEKVELSLLLDHHRSHTTGYEKSFVYDHQKSSKSDLYRKDFSAKLTKKEKKKQVDIFRSAFFKRLYVYVTCMFIYHN
jgi:hypothetical protein